jgi:ATP-dependent helicase/DNAse subunit B
MTERPSPFAMPSHAPPGETWAEPRKRKPHVSVSQLNEFVSCGHKFFLKRVRRVPVTLRPSWAMIGGKAVHETFDDVVRMRLKGKPEEAAGRFVEHLITQVEAASEIVEDQSKWKASGKASAKWPLKENLD